MIKKLSYILKSKILSNGHFIFITQCVSWNCVDSVLFYCMFKCIGSICHWLSLNTYIASTLFSLLSIHILVNLLLMLPLL